MVLFWIIQHLDFLGRVQSKNVWDEFVDLIGKKKNANN